MTLVGLLAQLRELNIKVWVDGDRLRYKAPAGALTPALETLLRQHKAELLDFLRAAQDSVAPQLRIEPQERPAQIPLSFAQQRLWFLSSLDSESAVYALPGALRLSGPLDAAALVASLNGVVARHEVLRTSFAVVDGVPIQVIQPTLAIPLPLIDFAHLPAAQRDAAVAQQLAEAAAAPFDLAQPPLLRACLLRCGPTEHILFVTMHHSVSDGWSIGIFISELLALYRQQLDRQAPALPPLPIQYADYALWQRAWLQGPALQTQLAYWQTQLAGLDVLALPTDYPRPAVQSFAGGTVQFQLDGRLVAAVQALSQQAGVTPFMTLLAGFQLLLARYSGQERLAVGTPIAGRARRETEGLIGFFVNTLVLRTELGGDPTFLELLGRVRQVCLDAYAHQDVPFERLVEALQPERSLSYNPLFQVMFSLQNAPLPPLDLADLAVAPVELESPGAQFDLTLSLVPEGDGLRGMLEYSSALYQPATVARMAEHYQALLAQAVAEPNRQVQTFDLLTPAEAAQIQEWQGAPPALLPDAAIHRLVAAQAARQPLADAVICGADRLSYGELVHRANQLAWYLQRQGVGPNVRVGVALERSLDLVVAMLGVLAAGGVFVPLDPAYPSERLAFMLADAQAALVLTADAVAARLPLAADRLIRLDALDAELAGQPATAPPDRLVATDLAYIIYTSGSTGTPKGVCVEHGIAANHLITIGEVFGFDAQDCVLQFASPNFDVSIEQVFAPLLRGARIVLRDPDVWPTELFWRKIAEFGITVVNIPPAYWHQLTEESAARPELIGEQALKLVIIGGDAMLPETARLWQRLPLGAVRLLNAYGPTEATITASVFEVPELTDQVSMPRHLPIGGPVGQRTMLIIDRHGKLLPQGIPGEIHIGGALLARGYHHRPDLTAEKFIPDAFAATLGQRLYRTGDLGRYLADGSIEFLGRVDHQVKLRGFRIELGEIEAALRRHAAISDAVVITKESAAAQQLVAYVIGREGQADLQASELRAFLLERLPGYMVPAAFVVLDTFPLTPNGKLDRRALPAPDLLGGAEAAFVAPQTATEELLADLWQALLGVPQVGRGDNFFALGGHSLLATQLVARIRNVFACELPLRALFEAPTLAALASALDVARQQTNAHPAAPALVPQERPAQIPLSFAQQRLWFLEQLTPNSTLYLMPNAVRITGALDLDGLAASLNGVVARHEVLRTGFALVDGQPIQVIQPSLAIPLPLIDFAHLPAAQRAAAVQQQIEQDAQQPFDLAEPPLLRARLLRCAPAEHILVLTLHHSIADGWSIGILINELLALYRQAALPPLPIQYADYALWQRAWLQGPALQSQLAYWQTQLAGLDVLALPTDYPRPAVQTFQGASYEFTLGPEALAGLQALSQRAGVTLFMTLLAGFQLVLHRYSGQERLAVGTPIAGRTRRETEGLIGFFINTLVLRTELSGSPTFLELLGRVRQVCLDAYAHQDVPFERVVEAVQPERSLGHTPLFQVFFNMLNFNNAAITAPDLKLEALASPEIGAKFDLTLYAVEQQNGLGFTVGYNATLFKPERIALMAEQLGSLFGQIIAEPAAAIDQYSLATTGRGLPDPTSPLASAWFGAVHERFAHQAQQSPEQIAVVDRQASRTYRQLDAGSNQLANYLRERGIGKRDVVAIYGQRSADLVVALLGVLKAGAAFMILDPAYPAARLSERLEVAQARALIELATDEAMPAEVGAAIGALGADHLRLPRASADLDYEPLRQYSGVNPGIAIEPDDLAYVAFTSGSTGQPKGILGTHRPLSHFMDWHSRTFALNQRDRFSMLSGLAHDPLLRDVFAPLWVGAGLHIPDAEIVRSPGALAEWMQRSQISIAHLTPALAQLLEDQGAGDLAALRYAFFSGDSLTGRHCASLKRVAPGVTCVNFYGATETPQAMGYWIVPEQPGAPADAAQLSEPLPIGQGIDNVQILVLNRQQRLAGVGEVGEIFIRTPYLAQGYLNADDQPARFLANPFTALAEDRVYRTGDLARYLPDGNVKVIGRADSQVKIRGFRVELGEIAALLGAHPELSAAVVVAQEHGDGDRQLVAYVVARQQAPGVTSLRRFLQTRLPDYMIPSIYMPLDALPLTPNGKIDYKALPLPEALRPDLEVRYVAPGSEVEQIIAAAWKDVLQIDKVGIHDNFFDLGGHSLLVVQLHHKLRAVLEKEISLMDMFTYSTVSMLAAYIEQSAPQPNMPEQGYERGQQRKALMDRRLQARQRQRLPGQEREE